MSIKQKLTEDVKAAMLAHDAARLECLRGLKSVILYAEVAAGKREEGLADVEIQGLFAKESKKRQESADLYMQGGSQVRADKELAEKKIIEEYLPAQLSEIEITTLVQETIDRVKATSTQDMGRVMKEVKALAGNAADGSILARIVKEKLS